MKERIFASAGAIALAGVLSACAGPKMPPYPLPDEAGLYAITPEDELMRLDGDSRWEVKSWPQRADLNRFTEFVIYDPMIPRDSRTDRSLATIWRVAWLRSEIDSRGFAGPIDGSEWVVAPLDSFIVPATAEPVQGWPGYVHVVPDRPLQPGLYSLKLNRGGRERIARFGVGWNGIDKRRYAARNCVDRYSETGSQYRACADDQVTRQDVSTEGLEITLVDPTRRGTTLVVQGIVTNTTERAKRLPSMRAILLDKAGRRLTNAVIVPRKSDLSAGERLRFRTEIANAPPTTARIDVDFIPMTSAGK
ncbi:FxLYD domain-containing protein [Pelagibius marinus]|uniref:FxLYD domain-containing protein n=1 Tax=Pelagibius marinus TaxID=2762760 RepID=UPI0018724A46|nr:FxLYD domain-containing protein [Pelagibius marinus]